MIECIWNTFRAKDEDIEKFSAYLFYYGFESYYQEKHKLHAFINDNLFDKNNFTTYLKTIPLLEFDIYDFEIKKVVEQNWNALWESNFDPVVIDNFLYIRAPFHPSLKEIYTYEIIINPKMSFGTGHHATTAGMLEIMNKIDFIDKKVVDMGCGTGILSIFASLKGAKKVTAIDNDLVCIENTSENILLNKINNINLIHGNHTYLYNITTDIILANITKNILIEHMNAYSKSLRQNGLLLISGFFIDDFEQIYQHCNSYQFNLISNVNKNNWCISLFKKSS